MKIFVLISKLAAKLGVAPLNGKMWIHQIDEHWLLAVNGAAEPRETGKIGQAQVSHNLAPFTAYVEFNGWPAGMFTPHGGEFAAGAAANEKTFCAAIEEALK